MVVEMGSAAAPVFVLQGSEDRSFDSIYPADVRALSSRFWTPVAVAANRSTALRPA